jgi:hypothetical protein
MGAHISICEAASRVQPARRQKVESRYFRASAPLANADYVATGAVALQAPSRQCYIRRLEPERQRFLRVRDSLFLGVPGAGAIGKLRKYRRPSLHFGIELYDKTKFHGHSLVDQSVQSS